MIKSIAQAFKEIEKRQQKVPFKAIEFLYNHPKDERITDKLKFSLENAYNNEIYYDKFSDYHYPTPLWYAIVSENHLSKELIPSIISLYTATERGDWDYLNEQGLYLVGRASKELEEDAIKLFLDAIEAYSKGKTQHPTLFLHECLSYADSEEYLPQILRILDNKDYLWIDSFAVHLAHAQIKDALPKVKEVRKYYDELDERIASIKVRELDSAIEELESGILKYPDLAKPMCEKRENWKEIYKNFYRPRKVKTALPKRKKIGRNEPCPCGSGKKYKKCCL